MKRSPALFTAMFSTALLSTTLLAACGSSGSSGKSASDTSSAASTTSSAATSGTTSSSASSSAAAGGSITIGSADFPENELLMDIYADAWSAKGVKVSKKPNIGERGAYIAALKDGSINAIPEYSGSILTFFNPKATAKTPADVYKALQSAAAGQGLVALPYAQAQDSDSITVTKATATKYKLTSIADLKPVAGKLTFGAPAQFKTRADGIPALKSVYGVVFKQFTPLRAGGTFTVNALKNGSVDAADVFTTDPSIVKNNFVPLKDPKSMFAAQNIVPLVSKSKVTKPITDASAAIASKLTTEELVKLVTQVTGGKDPDSVAKAWLSSNGLS